MAASTWILSTLLYLNVATHDERQYRNKKISYAMHATDINLGRAQNSTLGGDVERAAVVRSERLAVFRFNPFRKLGYQSLQSWWVRSLKRPNTFLALDEGESRHGCDAELLRNVIGVIDIAFREGDISELLAQSLVLGSNEMAWATPHCMEINDRGLLVAVFNRTVEFAEVRNVNESRHSGFFDSSGALVRGDRKSVV